MSRSILVTIQDFSTDKTGLYCDLEAKLTQYEDYWYVEELYLAEVNILAIVSEEFLNTLLPKLLKKEKQDRQEAIRERAEDDQYFN